MSSQNGSAFKFDTSQGSKQRVAHKSANAASASFLQELEHKKQSITQMLTKKLPPSPPKRSPVKKQSLLTSFLTGKPAKRSFDSHVKRETHSSDDSDEDGLKAETAGSSSGSSGGWLAKKAALKQPKKAEDEDVKPNLKPEVSLPRPQLIPPKPRFPPPPIPMDFVVKRRAVISSDEEDNALEIHQKMSAYRKAIKISDEDEPMGSDDDEDGEERKLKDDDDEEEEGGDWLSASHRSNAFGERKMRKPDGKRLILLKNRSRKNRMREDYEFVVHNDEEDDDEDEVEELAEEDERDDDDEEEEEEDEADSSDVDSDDSSADERLTERQKKKLLERERQCLDFVNNGTAEQLAKCTKLNAAFVDFALQMRPFGSFSDMREKAAHRPSLNLSRSLDGYMELLETQRVLDRVLEDCREHSQAVLQSLEQMGKEKPVEMPPGPDPKYSLHPYQQVGLNWLIMLNKLGLNAILADEMGLGKTIQVISFFAWAHSQRQNPKLAGPHLILVPSSTMDNWIDEIARWAPQLKLLTYYGSAGEREEQRREAMRGKDKFDLILTTYRSAVSTRDDVKFFKKYRLNYICFDEGHMLKNCATKRYADMGRLNGKRKILLTGTPLQNNLVELISLLYFTMRELFDKYCPNIATILEMFATKEKAETSSAGSKGKGNKAVDEERKAKAGGTSLFEMEKIEQAKDILRPFLLRRTKTEVLNLPEKHERIEHCEMTPLQAQLYAERLAELPPELIEGKKFSMNQATELRMAANHPLLRRRLYDDQKLTEIAKRLRLNVVKGQAKQFSQSSVERIVESLCCERDISLHLLCRKFEKVARLGPFLLDERLALESGKFRVLDRMLPAIFKRGDRVLIFSQYILVLDLLELYLKIRKHRFLRLDGETAVFERQTLIDQFNEDPAIPVFLLSTKAGGLGINLTGANHIIIHDIDINPYNDKQAEDRVHRIGQTKEVFVTRLVSKGTIEEQMLAVTHKKLELAKNVTGAAVTDGVEDEFEEDGRKAVKSYEQLLRNMLKRHVEQAPQNEAATAASTCTTTEAPGEEADDDDGI